MNVFQIEEGMIKYVNSITGNVNVIQKQIAS